ncbi:Protein of unknown function [Pyronema omphalodes CBS 100304]|uniref:Uncharacterized protein n=1 Tax=Pyronema omphalodes (strain CBS 100304) TaxID=1076935 RepID=U4LSQ6_PYROM|nr:Protein of unknown function [Pyronema omphalodes CBS 100304]
MTGVRGIATPAEAEQCAPPLYSRKLLRVSLRRLTRLIGESPEALHRRFKGEISRVMMPLGPGLRELRNLEPKLRQNYSYSRVVKLVIYTVTRCPP